VCLPLHVVGGAFAPPIAIHLRLQEVNQTINVADEADGVGLEVGSTPSSHRKEPDDREGPVLDQDIVSTFTPFLANSAVGSKGITLWVAGRRLF